MITFPPNKMHGQMEVIECNIVFTNKQHPFQANLILTQYHDNIDFRINKMIIDNTLTYETA